MCAHGYRRGVRILGHASALLLCLVLVGCPGRGGRRTLVPEAPQSGDAEARRDFQAARAKFLRDGKNGEDFRRIVEEYPDDPIVPWAQLYAGIAAVGKRDFPAAAKSLKEVIDADADPNLTTRAQLFLGITKNYQGDFAGALPLLQKGAKMVEGDAEKLELLAALAYAHAGAGKGADALPYFDQLYSRVTPTERAAIVGRVEEVVAVLEANALAKLFETLDDRKGPSIALVASRLAILAEDAGNANDANRYREAAAAPRAAVGLPRTISRATATTSTVGNSGLVGAVMPFGGKQNRVAESAVAGLGMAAGVNGGPAVAAIEVRTADDPAAAAVAVEELAKANVVAIVGPIDAASVDAAAARAESLNVPLLSLSGTPEQRTTGRFVFHMRHSAEARARGLAQRALSRGVKAFAVLAPDNGYGRAVTAAFVAQVQQGGGTIVTTVKYPPDTKSFPSFANKLDGKWDAVFVPDRADKLGLITPAIAASGRLPKPLGTKRVTGGRPVLLLSTAEGLTGQYIGDAGRLSEGAWLAPGFYPDDTDPASKAFLDQFIASYGRAPGVTEAYAYDAAQLAASAGGGGRLALVNALASGQLSGLTGTISFDKQHRRSDAGVVYTIVESNGAFAIRVAR